VSIKEKVLKEVGFKGEMLKDLAEFRESIIDLTLEKVAEAIDEDIRFQKEQLKGVCLVEYRKQIKWRITGFEALKKKLGIRKK
jgi:hypothetical protein